MEKAERVLGKVETALRPTEDSRPETITDEERFMFRKLGLRMKAFLLLSNSFVCVCVFFFWCWIFAQLLGNSHLRTHMSCYIFSLLLSQIACLFNPSFFLFLVADEQRY